MSHYLVAIIIKKEKVKNVENEIGELLAPYDEALEVEEYDEKCSCIGWKAVCELNKIEEENFGSWDALKKQFWKEVSAKYEITSTYDSKCTKKMSDEIDAIWEVTTEKRLKWKEEAFNAHPLHDKADPNCSSCKGTGIYKTTYNPDSKWDWWVIGGRFNGVIRAEHRSSADGFNFDEEYQKLEENITSVEDYVEQIEKNKTQLPFAIVTPDGEWYEEGNMGWFAVVSNKNKKWEDDAIDILKEYSGKDYAIVGIDLHI